MRHTAGRSRRGGLNMDKVEAVTKFLREHQVPLLADATVEEVEALAKHFHERHHLKGAARFHVADIAWRIAETLASSRSNSPTEAKTLVESSTFCTTVLRPHEIEAIVKNSTKQRQLLGSQDYVGVNRIELAEKIAKGLEQRIRDELEEAYASRNQEVESLVEQLRTEKASMEAFKTVLDTPSLDIPAQAPDDEKRAVANTHWWRDAGLTSDPFRSNRGLEGFEENDYDNVVVRTTLLQEFQARLGKAGDELLGRTFLVLGEFGSGKSTILQYLGFRAGQQGLIPINVILSERPSSGEIAHKYHLRLLSELERVQSGLSADPPQVSSDPEIAVLNLMKHIQGQLANDGFLITVDGLHKGDEHRAQVFKFLQVLQNYSEEYVSEGCRVCIIVAGSKLWERELTERRSFSGSFHRIDVIPGLEENEAVEAVVKRFKACGSDQAGGSVDRPPLHTAYQVLLARKKGFVTFRDYLDDIRARVEASKPTDQGRIYVTGHLESFGLVQKELPRYAVSRQITKVTQELPNESALRATARIVRRLFTERGIAESDHILTGNLRIFKLLRSSGLIVQQRHGQSFRWVLTNDFLAFLGDVFEKFRVPPGHTIMAIFSNRKVEVREESRKLFGGTSERTAELVTMARDSWPKLARALEATHASLDEIMHTVGQERLATSSLKRLAGACGQALHVAIRDADVTPNDAFSQRHLLWTWPEGIAPLTDAAEPTYVLPTGAEYWSSLQLLQSALTNVLDIVEECIQGEARIPLCHLALPKEDKLQLHQIRMHLQQGRLKQAVDASGELVEERVRVHAYLALRAWGGKNAAALLPKDVQEQLGQGKPRGQGEFRREYFDNFLREINRSQNPAILFDTKARLLLKEVGYDKEELQRLRLTFQQLASLDDRQAHRDPAEYFRKNATTINQVVPQLPKLLDCLGQLTICLLTIDIENERNPAGNSHTLRFQMKGGEQFSIALPKVTGEEIARTVLLNLQSNSVSLNTDFWYALGKPHGPEHHLAALRILLEAGYVELDKASMALKITLDGLASIPPS